MPKPTIVIVHGSYHTPYIYAPFITLLQNAGYVVHCPQLPTADLKYLVPDPSHPDFDYKPGTLQQPTQAEDAAVIQSLLKTLIDYQKKEVLLIAHSSGGWTAPESSVLSLQKAARSKDDKQGGIIGLFCIAAILAMPGSSTTSNFGRKPPGTRDDEEVAVWFKLHKSNCTTVPEGVRWLFHDVPEEEAQRYQRMLTGCPFLMSEMTNADVYERLPVAYAVTLRDRVLSVEYQEMVIKDVEERGTKVERYDVEGGHEAFLSQTQRCVDAVEDFVRKLLA
ncbi:alpha/beta-hydrolase [Polyplosphaeria fusca]|uniref:Alpha/beta-hydrolase n=1 Tax=Polyplosphaeria fusca TaxID=682080 RepID=A0A9P4RBT9_9PLEO|nr:alpha/beta-hydrolase [Polyplosphaeria fusca]